MPKLAKTIDVKRRGKTVTLTIDGEEFAWYLAAEPITTTTDPNEPGTVNLTLIAEHVTIDDGLMVQAQRERDSSSSSVTVDGESVPMEPGHHGVSSVLRAAGLDAPLYDLIRLDSDGRHVYTHRVGNMVSIKNGDQFIAARIAATT